MSTLLGNCKSLGEHTLNSPDYPAPMELKDRVREARLAAGIRSQSALARMCGCDSTAINKLENGGILSLSGDLLLKIAAATGVNANWLSTGAGQRIPAEKPEAKPERDRILDVLSAMPPEDEAYWRSRLETELRDIQRARMKDHRNPPPIPKPLASESSPSPSPTSSGGAGMDRRHSPSYRRAKGG
jgi:transcriptional regulator with XRE-family HTH domain